MVPDLGPRYELIRELGHGAAARTLVVRDLHLEKQVALKLFHETRVDAAVLEEARKEFALLAAIDHPGIARAYDFGLLGGSPYFTSELIPGSPLSAGDHPRGPDDLVQFAADLSDAIAFLHQNGILHLDIKASNIIACTAPGRRRVVLIDFGLFRKGLQQDPGSRVPGSVPYMAPESFHGEEIGPWTDVYAAGVTLYRVATGGFPRRAPEVAAALEETSSWDPAPRPPSELGSASTPDLDHIILRCLALDARMRFRSGKELLEALGRIGARPSAPQTAGKGLLATIGRTAELAEADRFLDDLLERTGGPPALLITGPQGAGQTHLIGAVKVRAQTRGVRFYVETGYAGRTSPPGSLLRALGNHLGDGKGPERKRWSAFLEDLRRPRKPFRSDLTEGERRARRASEVAFAASRIREPVVLAADGLQFWDEVSVELLADLLRSLEASPDERPPIGVVVGFREEGSLAPVLADLTDLLLHPGLARIITLVPLGLRDAAALYRSRGGANPGAARSLALHQQSGGLPRRIVALAAASSDLPVVTGSSQASGTTDTPSKRASRSSSGKPAVQRADLARKPVRAVLLTLEILGRPATVPELARLSGERRPVARRVVLELEPHALVARVHAGEAAGGTPGERSDVEWTFGPAGPILAPRSSAREISRAHHRIAARLEGEASGDDDPRLVEALRHFDRAGRKSAIVRVGLRAGSYLKANLQYRAALDVFRQAFEALPVSRRTARLELALELAEVHSRIGDSGVEEGIRMLQDLLPAARSLGRGAEERVQLYLATLRSRQGDYRTAEALFEEGLRRATRAMGADAARRGARSRDQRRPPRDRLTREELLLFTNEHAALKALVGKHAEAFELCERGLRLAGRSRRPEIREIVLNLHATRASVALRGFDFDAAIRDLERAADIAEAIGSPGNRATVLNNLGVVFIQCDRYQDAIGAFAEAERACVRLDEGPSLASVCGNLAVLHAKLGNFAAMERALGKGSEFAPPGTGRRQELFLRHARGLSLLSRGRYAAARPELEEAIRIGRALGDHRLVAYDEVYRAEALVFEARYSEADHELSRLSDTGPERARRMALARWACLGSLLGEVDEVERRAARLGEAGGGPEVPFLDAWDRLFLGWSLSLAGKLERALALLEEARAFFVAKGLRPAAVLAACVAAEGHLLGGNERRAEGEIDALTTGAPTELGAPPESFGNDLTAVLAPLLRARVLLGREGSRHAHAAADLLAQAGAALAGNPLPEWEARLDVLRGAFGSTGNRRGSPAFRRRREIARDLPAAARRRYLRGRHFAVWAGVPRVPLGPQAMQSEEEAPDAARELSSGTPTAVLASSRSRLVALSAGMRRLQGMLDRLRGVELPVLIRGEIGTGKELVARILHEESPRSRGPFRVIDCATIPAGLLESELFGAVAGAYTGIERDRAGILSLAAGGTVLVDEIAGAGLDVQAKLLRVISTGAMRPIGAEEESEVDVRFLFSTCRDLEVEIQAGRFREDLHHRVRVVVLDVPPLRDRPEDMEGLVAGILAEGATPAPSLGAGVVERLCSLEWTGNVRQLENVLARACIESPREITLEAISRAVSDPGTSTVVPRNLLAGEELRVLQERLERDYIVYHLRRLEGDSRALSRLLGISRRQFYRRCARLGIKLRGGNAGA